MSDTLRDLYGSAMPSRWEATRHRYRRWLKPAERRGVRILALASVVCLVGMTVTGIWQFFAHAPDPAWFGYEADASGLPPSSPSEGMAEVHSVFGTVTAAVALIGGAWLVYKVLFAVPWQAVAVLAISVFGLVSGSVMRFRAVKLDGRSFAEADEGYPQIFGADLEFVVNARMELGPTAIRLWTVSHVLTIPVLLAVIWFALPRTLDDR